jgi:predicted nucleic acid-binding protein
VSVAVADTSALVRLYLPDGPVVEGLTAAVEAAWRGDGVLLCPEIALAEMAQVLWKKEQAGYLTPEEADEVFDAFLDLPLRVITHRELLPDARILSRRHRLTVYDGLFLALAHQRESRLFTADEELAEAARRP